MLIQSDAKIFGCDLLVKGLLLLLFCKITGYSVTSTWCSVLCVKQCLVDAASVNRRLGQFLAGRTTLKCTAVPPVETAGKASDSNDIK